MNSIMKKIYTILIIALFGATTFLPAQEIPAFPKAETAKSKIEKPDDEKLAAEYMKGKEYEKAVELYAKLYEEKKTRYFYTYYIFCLTELQGFKTALKVVRREQKENPGSLRLLVDEGYIYSLQGDQHKAKKLWDEALEKLTANRNQINELAGAYSYRGQTEYALQTYLKGRQLVQDYKFNLELARMYQQMNNYADMVNEYLNLMDDDLSRLEYIKGRLQSALDGDEEGTIGEAMRTELLRRVQKNPDKIYYSEMLIWYAVQQKDFDLALLQSKSIDRRLGGDGRAVIDLAMISLNNEAYDVAVDAYEYVLAKGELSTYYLDARIGLLNARYLKITHRLDYTRDDLMALEREYHSALAEFGENSSTITIMKYLAHLQAFYLDKYEEAVALLEKAVAMPGVSPQLIAECKIELADILLFTDREWDATLLYSQVDYDFKNDPVGHLAKFKNAKLSYYIGEFNWAKMQLDVLKAATSKLIANDAMELSLLISDNIDLDSTYTALGYYARADLLVYRNKPDEALLVLDSIQTLALWHPLNDEVLYKKADIMLKKSNYQAADSLLQKVTEMYPQDILADDALILRARLYDQHFIDPAKAMMLYEQLMTEYPGSLFVVEARKRFRELRGDMIN
jgi:tetratricopeptide (TPR) repeat protein